MSRRRVLTPEAKEYLMENRHKPLHDLEDRGGGVPGKKPKEGHGKMNELLRKGARPTMDADKQGFSSLGEKSPGDLQREAAEKRRLAKLELYRKARG